MSRADYSCRRRVLSAVFGRSYMGEQVMKCDHNEMIGNNSQTHAWKCAKCGYVYGATQFREGAMQNKPLTADQKKVYIQHRYGKCPYCGSQETRSGSYDFDGETISKSVECITCERQWLYVYTLTGVKGVDIESPSSFGDFFQHVCSDLVDRHGWDDPYGSLAPQYNPSGKLITLIYASFHAGEAVGKTAEAVHNEWMGQRQPGENLAKEGA